MKLINNLVKSLTGTDMDIWDDGSDRPSKGTLVNIVLIIKDGAAEVIDVATTEAVGFIKNHFK